MPKKIYVISHQDVWLDIVEDIISFVLLMSSIWFSAIMDETFWTVVCVILLMGFFFAKGAITVDKKVVHLYSKEDAIEWAKNLPE